jgi:hypothetical protein
MDWIDAAVDWAKSQEPIVWWMVAASIVFVLLTPLAAAWAIVRLPPDYFTQEKRRPLSSWDKRPMLRMLLLIAKNLLGALLVLAGLAMLILPGQGLLTVLVGVVLVDFPGKFRLQRWIAMRPPVWRTLNWLRKRARRPELERPT